MVAGRMRRNTAGDECKARLTEDFTDPLLLPLLPSVGIDVIADLRDTEADRSRHVDLVVRYAGAVHLASIRVRCSCKRRWNELTLTSRHVNGKQGESGTGEATLMIYAWCDHDAPRIREIIVADTAKLLQNKPSSERLNPNGQRFCGWNIDAMYLQGVILQRELLLPALPSI